MLAWVLWWQWRHLSVNVAVIGAEVAQQAGAQDGVRRRFARGGAELRDARVLDTHAVEELEHNRINVYCGTNKNKTIQQSNKYK